MAESNVPQTFLFTFRTNEGTAEKPLAEILVEELADYDPAVKADAYKRSWFGAQQDLGPVMMSLGFVDMDVQAVMAALSSHRGVDRKLAVTTAQLESAGFIKV